jgi:hypothetical protein
MENGMEKWKILWSFGLCIIRAFGISCGYLGYIMAIWDVLWLFGIYSGYFFPFWYIVPRKIWQPRSGRIPLFSQSSSTKLSILLQKLFLLREDQSVFSHKVCTYVYIGMYVCMYVHNEQSLNGVFTLGMYEYV